MLRNDRRKGPWVALSGLSVAFLMAVPPVAAADATSPLSSQAPVTVPARENTAMPSRSLTVTVGKSLIVDSPVNIQRVAISNDRLAEALAVNPREVLVNGKAPGETSLIIWQQGGNRLFYDLTIRQSTAKIDAVRQELSRELPGQEVTLTFENDTAFLRGTVRDMVGAERAEQIAGTLGKVVNLLRVLVPPVDTQILLKVRFANVDRKFSQDLGVNLFSTGALNTIGSISTGQFTPPQVRSGMELGLTDALNVFLFRRDINLGATIRALQARNLLEILAEPNVLAINGKQASFVAGGEFPYPTLQGGGAGLGAVTIQFREFGIRINFLPNMTPRGTIRLQVMPEVSSLDFANGLLFQGFNIPALATRRVTTEVELEDGQSFAIAGMMDNRVEELLEKVPGLANIPVLGKMFQSRSKKKTNTELLVMVTPEIVRPIPADQSKPQIEMPEPFMETGRTAPPRTPGMDVTGPVPIKSEQNALPVEKLQTPKSGAPGPTQGLGPVQFVPVPVAPPTTTPLNPTLPPPGAPGSTTEQK